jgi:hypothetical protein
MTEAKEATRLMGRVERSEMQDGWREAGEAKRARGPHSRTSTTLRANESPGPNSLSPTRFRDVLRFVKEVCKRWSKRRHRKEERVATRREYSQMAGAMERETDKGLGHMRGAKVTGEVGEWRMGGERSGEGIE